VANNVQAAALEISRKDFESTIERKIDLVLPADPKGTAQAAKVGQPIVEAVRSSKLSSGIVTLADMIAGSAAEAAEAAPLDDQKAKKSVMDGFKSLLNKKK
jgi:pilus assembly protein CpaE